MELTYGIVAVGYNRPDSMRRLLFQLNRADYLNEEILLIISIDYSGNDSVQRVADEFVWRHGDKKVVCAEHRLGLREHILKCGNYMETYHLDAIAVFEDDVYPSENFYNFMCQTVQQYGANKSIAGISLYSHRYNVVASMPFEPDLNGTDCYFMQFAQSWGQVWVREEWKAFTGWYEKHKEQTEFSNLPDAINRWPASSWLKYHIAYCVDQNKYFVYPYHSLTTCCSEAGEHARETDSMFQVPFVQGTVHKRYTFCEIEEGPRYDCYFEREELKNISIEYTEFCEVEVDLHGVKAAEEHETRSRYCLSMQRLPYQIVKSYGLMYRPIEKNVLFDVEGNDIFLYDRWTKGRKPKGRGTDELLYYYRMRRAAFWHMKYACGRIFAKMSSLFGR